MRRVESNEESKKKIEIQKWVKNSKKRGAVREKENNRQFSWSIQEAVAEQQRKRSEQNNTRVAAYYQKENV